MNTKNMAFQLALDAIRDAKDHLDSVDPTLHLAEIARCSVEDLQRVQHGVRAALAQLRDMESLYTGEADLKKYSDADLQGKLSDARNASRKLAIVLARLCDSSANDQTQKSGATSLLLVLTHDTVINTFREDVLLSQTLPFNELVHFVLWRALSSIEYATAVCENLQIPGYPTELTGKPCPDNVTSIIAATEELHAEALQLVPLLLQHVLRSSLGKCEQRAIDTLLRKSESEKLVVEDEQVVLICPGHTGTPQYNLTFTVNAKILHKLASAEAFAANDFSAAAEAHMRATGTDRIRKFSCGCQLASYWNNATLLKQVAAAFGNVADAEAEQVRACELQQRQYLFSIVNYSAVETAHCQVEDLRDRIQHELIMRKIKKEMSSTAIMEGSATAKEAHHKVGADPSAFVCAAAPAAGGGLATANTPEPDSDEETEDMGFELFD
mmetsp:Transcript_35088/g.59065  ORF Transcript_35088/g.59065 Transcript_35088/m.59065 type:complete len:440 (+) Transcript_35088:109-1428(+)